MNTKRFAFFILPFLAMFQLNAYSQNAIVPNSTLPENEVADKYIELMTQYVECLEKQSNTTGGDSEFERISQELAALSLDQDSLLQIAFEKEEYTQKIESLLTRLQNIPEPEDPEKSEEGDLLIDEYVLLVDQYIDLIDKAKAGDEAAQRQVADFAQKFEKYTSDPVFIQAASSEKNLQKLQDIAKKFSEKVQNLW